MAQYIVNNDQYETKGGDRGTVPLSPFYYFICRTTSQRLF